MKKLKSENGSITVFVIVAFIFCMTILVNLYWTSTNYQVTVLQAEQRIKDMKLRMDKDVFEDIEKKYG